MPDFHPHEPSPINDTPESKGLEHDPQIDRIEELVREAMARGMSQDEATALAWSQVEVAPDAKAPQADSAGNDKAGGGKRHPHPHDISLGG
jgi:uncharacterized protein YoaH (UPF0181 family)